MSIHRRVGKRGNTYEVRLRAPDGREISRTFRTEREARAFEADQRAAMHRGGWIDPKAATTLFRLVAERWQHSNPAKRPSTMARDDVTLRRHLIPTLGDKPIGQITPADVRTLVMTWLRQRKPSSVSRDYRTLAAICHFAVDQDLIARSPCRGIKLPTGAHRSVHVVDADELARLAKAMGDFGPMAYVAAVLGLRWGEVAGLKVRALDLQNHTLTVSEQITRGKGGQIVIGLPKSDAGRRTLSMPAALADLLRDHLDSGTDADAWVFPSTSGGPLHYANWYHRIWAPAVAAAGLEGLTFHDLRRANATGLVAAGVDVKTAQTRLGHSSSRLTLDLYAQAVAARNRDAAERSEPPSCRDLRPTRDKGRPRNPVSWRHRPSVRS